MARGPDFFLPLEFNARLGPIRINGEAGYDFGNHGVPQTWNRGMLVGHEFSDRTEVYLEIYDVQDANRIAPGQGVGQFATGYPKQRESTIGIGGRQAMNKARDAEPAADGRPQFPDHYCHQRPAQLDRLCRLPASVGAEVGVGGSTLKLMASPEIQYISDESGEPTAVIVPISLWREIEAERETAYLLKSDAMRRRLLEAKNRKEGLSIETVVEKLGI